MHAEMTVTPGSLLPTDGAYARQPGSSQTPSPATRNWTLPAGLAGLPTTGLHQQLPNAEDPAIWV
eukprot:2348487-Amphidinium_carterae.1